MRRKYLRNRARANIISYPGLIAAWSAKGKSNDDEDRATLKDLTGNGHDITLNNFAFSEMSGYGGYNLNLTKHLADNQIPYQTVTYNKVILKELIHDNEICWINGNKISNIPKLSWKVNNIKQFIDRYPNSYVKIDTLQITKDGIYTVDAKPEGHLSYWLSVGGSVMRDVKNNPVDLGDIEIELLPEYPDALVFDGVDDYGINDNMPIQEDFTFIYKAKPISDTVYAKGIAFSKRKTVGDGLFVIGKAGDSNFRAYSFGYINNIIDRTPTINYMTPIKFNNQGIVKGHGLDTDIFTIGSLWKTGELANMAFYSAYLFDRSLDEQEIKAFIRKYIDPEYLLPSEIPTPDCYYDFSQGSNDDANRDTIKDLSGNGNNAVAHNFAWNEEDSGYKDSALYFDGVDDYVSLDAFDSGFNTMFMVCKPFAMAEMIYDQRYNTNTQNYALYVEGFDKLAYNSRNKNGTYINNKFNRYYVRDVINKKQLIMVKTKSIETSKPFIGCNHSNTSYFSNMALYKFLGFKEALTEEQINVIIKKYNLLDGIDEIEVS